MSDNQIDTFDQEFYSFLQRMANPRMQNPPGNMPPSIPPAMRTFGPTNLTILLDHRMLAGQYVHDLSKEELIYLVRYLTDLITTDGLPAGVICKDHYSLWGWVAALLTEIQPDRMGMPVPHDDDELEDSILSEFVEEISNFYQMLHLALFPARHQGLDDRFRAFVSMMNPNVDGVDDLTTLGFAGTTGFSILEGLIHTHSDRLDQSGTITDLSEIDAPWISNDNPGFRTKLLIWQKESDVTNKEVRKVLDEIDNLNRQEYNLQEDFDIRRLQSRIQFDKQRWASDRISDAERESFFWILQEGRKHNIHGINSTQAIGPIVLNLCCLAFLDIISKNEYEEAQERLVEHELDRYMGIQQRMSTKITPDWAPNPDYQRQMGGVAGMSVFDSATIFYPIFDDAYEKIKQQRRP